MPPGPRGEWRAGWGVVASCAAALGTGAVLYQYVVSLFITSIEAELGWSRGDIALIGATPLLGALSAPLIGRVADRFGVRPVAIISTLIVAIAFFGLSQQGGSIAEAMAWMLLLGAAVPGTTGLVYSRAVTGWFSASRGLALGVMTSGISVSALIASPLIGQVVEAEGFRAGYLVLGLLAIGIALPAILIGVRERPVPLAEEGLAHAGEPPAKGEWRQQVKLGRFWLLAAVMLLMNIPSAGVLTQLAPLLGGKGFSVSEAAWMMSAYALSVLVGRIGVGWLFDRYPATRVAAGVTFLAAMGCIAFHGATPQAFVYFGILTVGLMQGAESDVLAYFVARMFPHRDFATVYGLQMTAGLLGTAIGVIAFGRLYDATQSYDLALMIAAAMLMVVVGLYLTLAGPMRGPLEAAH